MSKGDSVLREVLYRIYERNEPFMSQKSLAQACEVSLELPHITFSNVASIKMV